MIPETVSYIEENAFFDCGQFGSITVPKNCEVEDVGADLEIKTY